MENPEKSRAKMVMFIAKSHTVLKVKGITVPGVLNMYERRSKLLLAHHKIAIGLRPLMSRILGI